MLDLLAEACTRFKLEGRRGIDWVYFFGMTDQDRLDFDCFLVRTDSGSVFAVW